MIKPQILQAYLLTVTLLVSAAVMLSDIDTQPLWIDEAWSMWAVRDSFPEMLRRVVQDVHPPLYFILLDIWIAAVGESEFSARLLSLFIGLVGLAFVYRIGRLSGSGLTAVLLLGVHSFFIYQGREARMYMFLMTLSSISMWGYLRWLAHPRKRWTYIFLSAALLYTHYYGILILATQAIHLLLTQPPRTRSYLKMGIWVFLLYLPWLPAFFYQYSQNTAGPASTPIPTNPETIRWLLLLLTSGAGALVIIVFLLSRIPFNSNFLLMLLWLLVTPTCLLLLNLRYPSVYQIRYISAIVPALPLVLAYGIQHFRWQWLQLPILLILVAINLSSYEWLWFPKSIWQPVIAEEFVSKRQDDEPTLSLVISEASIEAYYDRQLHFRNQWAVDLKHQSAQEVYEIAQTMRDEPIIWAMLPPEKGESWLAMTELAKHRGIVYRNRLALLVIYGFDETKTSPFAFQFGQKFRFVEPFSRPISVQAASQFCLTVRLETLQTIHGEYSFGLHLADNKRNLVAQHDTGLGFHEEGQPITLTPCLTIPSDIQEGDYFLHLVIYNWQTGERLPVVESGVYWESYLVAAALHVE